MKPDNLIFIIFGASGDLTSRKLLPAIYSLEKQKMLPANYAILGIARTKMSNEEFRTMMREAIISGEKDESADEVHDFTRRVHYHQLDYEDKQGYMELDEVINNICRLYSINGNYIFYFATPPSVYEHIAVNLAETGFSMQDKGFRRFIIEKPFGYDLESSKDLNRKLHKHIEEGQIYRIDHFLGKETVQNLLVTRFANGIFEPLWNRNFVESIEVTSAESIGVENRGGYYDSAGALRDMVQNHMLQMAGLTAMEPPSSMDANAIRNEVLKVFQSFQPLSMLQSKFFKNFFHLIFINFINMKPKRKQALLRSNLSAISFTDLCIWGR
ncbi:MAG TPA: glucose-6-phosphate dehydrogenase [Bacteroidales bacterium]|nr:glucose-6-phosphate dehydrogenase [Bacteroidales bacterium]